MNSLQNVPALQYEVKIYEGLMDAVHGGGKTIKEIFIPTYQIIVNSEGGLYPAKEPRNVQSLRLGGPEVERPLKYIQLPLELVEKIAQVAKLKLEVSNKEMEVSTELKKIWK